MHVVTSTKEKIDTLEKIQKRAARFITGEYSKLTRITPLVKSLNLETLSSASQSDGQRTGTGLWPPASGPQKLLRKDQKS